MNKFSDSWKERSPYNKADVGEWYIVRVNGIEHSRWPNEKEACNMRDELKAQGVFGTVICEYPLETKSSVVKFERCVAHVKANNPEADAPGVCKAMITDKSFGEMEEKALNGLIDEALKTIGIDAAGPVPESLLARQDLEGRKAQDDSDDDTLTKSMFTSSYDLAERIKANQKPSRASLQGSTFKDMWARVRATNKK